MSVNIDAVLVQAEQEMLRLQQQAEQEAAMMIALPLRFKQNIEAFRQYIPHIAEVYDDYQPTHPFKLFCNENGQPNLEWIDDGVAVYGDQPYIICENLVKEFMAKGALSKFAFSQETNPLGFIHVEYLNKLSSYLNDISSQEKTLSSVPNEIPSALVFGVGLGYHLGYLYENCKIGTLFLFEPDLDLFYASLYCFDWAVLLDYLHKENMGLHILLGQDDKTVVKDFSAAIRSRGSFLIANAFVMWGYQNDNIKKIMDLIQQEYYQLVMGWGFFDDNLIALSHTVSNIERGVPFLKENQTIRLAHNRVPVFVIANGPSLDESLAIIKKNEDRAILIACGSAISALHRVGIKPDIYVATERTKIVYDFLVNLNDPEYLKDILFFSTDVIHPDCATLFNNSVLVFKSMEPGVLLCKLNFPESRDFISLGGVNPMVGNIGVSAPIQLGFKEIYLFGLDNGYKEKSHHHSKFSAYYNNNENAKVLGDIMYGDCQSDNKWQRTGNFGGSVTSNAMFDSSRFVIEQVLANNDMIQCFNCSNGARIAGTIPLPANEICIHQSINKLEVINDIVTRMSAPLSLSKQDFYPLLDVEFFCYFIDKIFHEWSVRFSSRNEINQLMLRHFSYLAQIDSTRQKHIAQMMVGSMNYFFTLLSSILYSVEAEEAALTVMESAITIWLEFLRTTKDMYPQALDRVDMIDDHEMINLFKK
ncbi:motility associated factor glycosyltransferase family protein [Aeromonas allosaccharophila]|uniref:motility associated factor glycosyltransferase family protein n=1 Tax=Aeromonas allosaccharophila TaxID=656 RepID=UPI003D1EAB64